METIKKYQNRKLYSTTLSQYVTLNYIIDLVKTNQKFIVIENKSRKDITYLTMKQAMILLDIPSKTLTDLIKVTQ